MNELNLKDHPYVQNLLSKNQIQFRPPDYNGLLILCSTDRVALGLIKAVFDPQILHDNYSDKEMKQQTQEQNPENQSAPKKMRKHRLQSCNQDVQASEILSILNKKHSQTTK